MFLRLHDGDGASQLARRHPALGEQALNAGEGVLQIRRGIAVEREHRLPVEEVVAGSILRQIRVLDGANAHRSGHALHLRRIERRILLGDQGASPRAGLVDQIQQARTAAQPRLERSPVAAQHRPERMMFQRRPVAVASGFRQREELAEVQPLARIHDVQHAVGAQRFGAIAQSGDVGGVVQIAAVGFAHDDRQRLAGLALELGQKDA